MPESNTTKISLEEFVDEIFFDTTRNADTKYIFFLGAGCSKSSGIPLAGELAKGWYEELAKEKSKYDKFNAKYKLVSPTEKDISEHYFEIFETLFILPISQQKEIQRITNNNEVCPRLGYYALASLMQNNAFNTVITTNFDDLVQDALIYTGRQRAQVITH